jgi:hypothetical protein
MIFKLFCAKHSEHEDHWRRRPKGGVTLLTRDFCIHAMGDLVYNLPADLTRDMGPAGLITFPPFPSKSGLSRLLTCSIHLQRIYSTEIKLGFGSTQRCQTCGIQPDGGACPVCGEGILHSSLHTDSFIYVRRAVRSFLLCLAWRTDQRDVVGLLG